MGYIARATAAEGAIRINALKTGMVLGFDRDLTAPAGVGEYLVYQYYVDLTDFTTLYVDAEGKDAINKLNFKIGGVELASFSARAVAEIDVSAITGNQLIEFYQEQNAGGDCDCYIYHLWGF